MTTEATAYPLCWPAGWKRARERRRAAFKQSQDKAQRALMDQLRMMGATRVILSTNIKLRNDGLPYAQQPRMDDPGVAVYFDWSGKSMTMACDVWDTLGANMRAIALSIEALRGLERWGCSEVLERAFTGFAALPSPGMVAKRPWFVELGWTPSEEESKGPDDIRRRRMELAKRYHPDTGGPEANGERMAAINAACELGLKIRSVEGR